MVVGLAVTGLAASAATAATVASAAARPAVASAVLLDAAADRPVPGRGPLRAQESIDLTELGTRELSVRAHTSPERVGSVRFQVNGATTRVENHLPYVLNGDGDRGRDHYPWTPEVGTHTIVITPYSGKRGKGTAGTPVRIRLTVTDRGGAGNVPVPAPTATPTPTATPAPDRPALPPTPGRYLYVKPDGDDRNDGTSQAKAVRTLQKGADLARPGDTVLVLDGTYTGDPNGNVLTVRRGGVAGKPVTIAAHPGAKPLVRTRGWNGVSIETSHVVVQGLTIEGIRDEITLDEALAQKENRLNPRTNGNGISVTPPRNAPDRTTHHVAIRGNVVRKVPGAGISAIETDHVTIEGNTVSETSNWTLYGTSGISVFHSRDVDADTGYKTVVRGNRTFDNRNYVPWIDSSRDPAQRKITDGNGIIVDDNRNTQIADRRIPAYRGRILVENNISYRNGGGGVNVFSSDHVDVVHNTVYQNSASPEIGDREISANRVDDVRIANNISVPLPGHKALTVPRPGGAEKVVTEANLVDADPRFVDPAAGDFRLRPGSPAIDAATATAAGTDANGEPRTRGRAPDRGAIESA